MFEYCVITEAAKVMVVKRIDDNYLIVLKRVKIKFQDRQKWCDAYNTVKCAVKVTWRRSSIKQTDFYLRDGDWSKIDEIENNKRISGKNNVYFSPFIRIIVESFIHTIFVNAWCGLILFNHASNSNSYSCTCTVRTSRRYFKNHSRRNYFPSFHLRNSTIQYVHMHYASLLHHYKFG